MNIKYYTDGKIEILLIKDKDGTIVKKGRYTMGNCLVDILNGADIVCDNKLIQIEREIGDKTITLLDKCDDYLYNDIKAIIESDLSFIFESYFSYRNVFIENKLCQVYALDDIHILLCLLLTNIYQRKLIYKRCKNCDKLFATRYSKAKFCKRIATRSGKTCAYANSLKMNRKKHEFSLH